MMHEVRDIYAGSVAWRNWFELCAVRRCCLEEQKLLARQITSSFSLALSRYGLRPSDFEREDLCELFDIHFLLNGNRTSRKPLKQYYLARIDKEDSVQLKKLICGTFFSAKCGLILTMARTVIPLIKGWRARVIDGKIVWEASPAKHFDDEGEEQDLSMPSIQPARLKEDPRIWCKHITGIFLAIGGKRGLDAPLLVYCIANGIRPSNKVVWKHLGVGSVMSNRRFHQALSAMARYMKKHKLTFEDSDFVASLLKSATTKLGERIVRELEESK